MSWLSKAAKKVEKTVSIAATKIGVGSDLKKAANIFGASNVGGIVGGATGFLTGGVYGALYGGATGAVVAGIGKYKGDSSSKYLSNAAGDAAIAGSIGPLIYKPAGTAVVFSHNAAGEVVSQTVKVQSANGGLIGSLASGASNAIKDAVSYIGKGGITQLAIDGLKGIFGGGKGDPGNQVNPDYNQGNAVPPGGSFTQWLNGVLPGKSYDPTAPGTGGTAGGGGSNPSTSVEVGGPTLAGTDGSSLGPIGKYALIGATLVGGYFLLKKGHGLHV